MYPFVSYEVRQLHKASVAKPTFVAAIVLVDGHVISQLLVGAEHLLAVRAGSGLLRRLALVCRLDMFDQCLFGWETPRADLALEL